MRPGIELAGKRVLALGLARTGVATALFCVARGASVTVTDDGDPEALGNAAQQLRSAGCTVKLGKCEVATFLNQDLVIPSPGVPSSHPGVLAAREMNIRVWSEIELAWRYLRGRLIAITGSNGKTTTTSLVGHILESAGMSVAVAGNIGTPLISTVNDSTDDTITVAEMSSFQLELIDSMRPDIAVLLNVTPDHLDRHGSFDAYRRAKARVFENQTERDVAVLNNDDPAAVQCVPARAQVYWFSRQSGVVRGAYLCDGQIVFRGETGEIPLLARADIRMRGDHNIENVLAAASAAFVAGASPSAIATGVRTFPGVEHRLEFVAEIRGVNFYNDSKATNVDATRKALDAFSGGLFVILGGKDKESDYTPLAEPLSHRAKEILLIGAAAEKIAKELAVLPRSGVSVQRAQALDRAVALAFDHALPGDTVLLSPACASFDQFDNYEHRGRVFKELVRTLQESQSISSLPAREG